MRAHGNEARLGRRFAIVIGVAAAGVMALGAQTATSTTGPVDTPPDLRLSGAKRQHPQAQAGHVYVTVRCLDQGCTTRVTGRLTKVKEDKLGPVGNGLRADSGLRVGLKLPRKTRKQVRRALNEGKTVKAKVTVRAHDGADNVAIAKRTIKLVK